MATSELIGCSNPGEEVLNPARVVLLHLHDEVLAVHVGHHICGPVSSTCVCVMGASVLRRAALRCAVLTSLCARVSCSALPLFQCTSHTPSISLIVGSQVFSARFFT